VQQSGAEANLGANSGTVQVVWQSPERERQPVALEPPREMVIVNPAEAIHCVDVRLSTYGLRNPGVVRLEVLTESGQALAKSEIVAREVMDNQFEAFEFREPIRARGQRLRLRLSYLKSSTEPGIMVAWSPSDDSNAFNCRVFGH
jgi:hypothetical protein